MDKPSLTYINKLSNGDEKFSADLIAAVKNEFKNDVESYSNNIAIKEYKFAAKMVHKLKHKIGILSYESGYFIAAQHEENLKEGDKSLEQSFDEVLQIISKYLTLI